VSLVVEHDADDSVVTDPEDEENDVPAFAVNNKGAQHDSGAVAAGKIHSKASPLPGMGTDQRYQWLTSASYVPS
jgi:hypothetical protein